MSREQVDLGYIWDQVNELAAILEENRQYTNEISEKASILTALFKASDFRIDKLTLAQRRALEIPEDEDEEAGEDEFHDAESGEEEEEEEEEEVEEVEANPSEESKLPDAPPYTESEKPNPTHPIDAPPPTITDPSAPPTKPAKSAKSVRIADPKTESKIPRKELEQRLATLDNDIAELRLTSTKQEAAYQTQTQLVKTYETALSQIIDQIRSYSLQQSKSIINIHKSYNTQLQNERQISEELRNENARILDGVRELSKGVRQAYSEGLSESKEVQGLIAENLMLREALGLQTATGQTKGGKERSKELEKTEEREMEVVFGA